MVRNTWRKVICSSLMAAGICIGPAEGQQRNPDQDVAVTNDLEYAKAGADRTRPLMLDVYCSLQGSHAKQPAIMFIHGGGFWQGDKRSDLYIKMASAYARRNYVAFSVNYTLKDSAEPYSPVILKRCVSEVAAAMHWIRANSERFGIDTSKLFVCGDSAGGGIAVNLSYDSFYGVYVSGCIDLWGGLPGNPGWNAPIFAGVLNRHTPATCIIHGTKDHIVPFATSVHLGSALKAAGIYQEIHGLKDADHYPVQLADQFIPMMMAFTDKIIGIRK